MIWKKRVAVVIFLLVCSISLSKPAYAVVVELGNVVIPKSAGEVFSFDLLVSDPTGPSAQAFQCTISDISGPGVLTLDATESKSVVTLSNYWLYDNSATATVIDNGNNSYTFGDNPSDGVAQVLATDDIVARYAFIWDGTVGDYTVSFDLDTSRSFIQNESFAKESFQFSPGSYDGSSNSFTVAVPEPTTLMLFALVGIALLKKRNVHHD